MIRRLWLLDVRFCIGRRRGGKGHQYRWDGSDCSREVQSMQKMWWWVDAVDWPQELEMRVKLRVWESGLVVPTPRLEVLQSLREVFHWWLKSWTEDRNEMRDASEHHSNYVTWKDHATWLPHIHNKSTRVKSHSSYASLDPPSTTYQRKPDTLCASSTTFIHWSLIQVNINRRKYCWASNL